ncbi:FAD-binding oxidoreductase [Salimicrobium humidisoli]|uniref:D-lactate dehydrogenase (cytochrome) n=1 Tax=Salimicrobium humidisoli TaxID=2029857 RepID=A0ABX4HRV4_9BACI|nr:FAD-linked oxidase C-terminal domain-containing protein [Salimicrobium humidisoli]PBB05559.1 2-hydroxy-acid oxidase [Salimicrobium humidisoli]
MTTYPATLQEELLKFLRDDQVSANDTVLANHSKDESYHEGSLPDLVVFPENAEEVSQIMKAAETSGVPVIPFGLGSSLEGNVIAYDKGITIDFSSMNRVTEVRDKDFLVKVQPGVTRSQLNKELKKYGLFFSVDPGADATLGGMAATNASGTTSVKYGVMKDQVQDLEVVTPGGDVIHTGSLARKSSSGYNLTSLYVGSEGTLGCITELTLRVYGIPEHVMAARASFPTIDYAVGAVISMLQAGVPVARVELLDEASIRQVNRFNDTDYIEKATLFLEFHGNEAGLQEDVAFMEEIVSSHKCEAIDFEKDNAARVKLWEARHNLAYAYIHDSPGKKMMVTDVCLPISELGGAIRHGREKMTELGLNGGILGHVGDGNYHALLMIDMDKEEERRKAEMFNEEIVEYALARGGTCTGEHGVGKGKMKYQEREHGKALAVMKAIKEALDPEGIMNPGKLIHSGRGNGQ